MRRMFSLLVAVLLASIELAVPSYARTASHSSHLMTRGAYTAPVAFQIFCLNNPNQCTGGGSAEIALTSKINATLQAVNASVNRTIRPQADRLDTWSVNVRAGDCEDFVLTKRAQLIAAGIPRAALRIATALTAEGIGHAVLIVRTDVGDLVLDSLSPRIKPWDEAQYRWVAMSGSNPRTWNAIV